MVSGGGLFNLKRFERVVGESLLSGFFGRARLVGGNECRVCEKSGREKTMGEM